jgi:2-haloacid dehalogenase
MYLVSNGTASIQRSRIASSDIERYFEGIFISEEVGYNKPDKAYFDVCFATIEDFDPKQAVIVGDSLSSDIQGGKNAGITTVWFNPKHLENTTKITPDYEIGGLMELLELLETL